MSLKWSPGCGCCSDPEVCYNESISFTPTTPYGRGGYTDWTALTAYTTGQIIARDRLSDNRKCSWEVPSDLTSGSSWDSTEEARYTFVAVIDYYDEVTEWDLWGSGWGLISAAEKDDYLTNGRLAQGMGYISKADVLPDINNFRSTFNFNINFRISPFSAPTPPLKYQLFAGIELDGSDDPYDYFACDVEFVENADEPTEENLSFPRPIKLKGYRVVAQATDATYDTHWTNAPASGQRSICRRPEVSGGSFAGCVDIDDSPTLSTLVPVISADNQNKAWTVINGPGTISGTTGTDLSVTTGNIIQLDDWSDPYDTANWTVHANKTTISLTDVLDCGLSTENPDPADGVTGLKVGVYIVTGQAPDAGKIAAQSPDITDFTGATITNSATLTKCECAICAMTKQCPCAATDEFAVFAEFVSTTDLTEFLAMFPTPNSSHSNNAGTGFGSFTAVTDSHTNLGAFGSTLQRDNECQFRFIKAHAFTGQAENGSNKASVVSYAWQYTTLTITRHSPFTVRVSTESEIRLYSTIYETQLTTFPTPPTIAELITALGGSIDDAWDNKFFENDSLYFLSASGSAESSLIELESFDCTSFTLSGTYLTDGQSGSPTNTWINDTWTVQSV